MCQFDILLPDEPVDQGHRQKTLSVLVSRAVTCECGWLSGDELASGFSSQTWDRKDDEDLLKQADRVGRGNVLGRLHNGRARR